MFYVFAVSYVRMMHVVDMYFELLGFVLLVCFCMLLGHVIGVRAV